MKERRKSYEITIGGVAFTGVSGFVLIAAVNSGSNPLFFAFGLMVGMLVVSAVTGAVMLRGITVERQVGDHVGLNEIMEVHYRVLNHRKRWPCFALRLSEGSVKGKLRQAPEGYCLHVGPGEQVLVPTRLTGSVRGVVELQEIRCACAFPFGFVRRVVRLRRPHRIVVYPRIGTLGRDLALRCRNAAAQGSVSTNIRGGNDEFYGVREYRAGDNVHAIHWRRTARTGEMVVREMTTDAPPQMIVALNLRSWADFDGGDALAERAIELAASLICHGFLEGDAVGLQIAGLPDRDGLPPRSGREQRARLLESLALVNLEQIGEEAAGGWREGPRIVVTLRQNDTISDLAPAGVTSSVLAMDQPGSSDWIHFHTAAPSASDELASSAGVPGQQEHRA